MKIIKSRIIKVLVALFLVGFVLGIICFLFSKNKENSIINYFSLIKSSKFNYKSGFITSIIYNYKYAFIIWVSGLVLFLCFIIPFLSVFRGICVGFTISSIICSFGIKGLLVVFILVFPCILINEIIYLLLSYYGLNFSFRTFNTLKLNKSINLRLYIKNYTFIFFIFLIILLLSSIFEIYITSNLIRFVI